MTISVGLLGSAGVGERPARAGAPGPERPASARARPRSAPPTDQPALQRLARTTHFLIHQLLAEAPELGRAPPCRPRTLAAYQAQLAGRIRYFGPVAPVDLRV